MHSEEECVVQRVLESGGMAWEEERTVAEQDIIPNASPAKAPSFSWSVGALVEKL